MDEEAMRAGGCTLGIHQKEKNKLGLKDNHEDWLG
jgi:hypothetical protein